MRTRKRAQREEKSAQEYEDTGFATRAGRRPRKRALKLCGARIERQKKSIESVGEGIVVGAGFAVGGLGGGSFLASPILSCPGVALKWRAGLGRSSSTVVDYFTPRGTLGQLVEGTVLVQMAERKFKIYNEPCGASN